MSNLHKIGKYGKKIGENINEIGTFTYPVLTLHQQVGLNNRNKSTKETASRVEKN